MEVKTLNAITEKIRFNPFHAIKKPFYFMIQNSLT